MEKIKRICINVNTLKSEPNKNNPLLKVIINKYTEAESYETITKRIEGQIEKDFIDILTNLGIKSSLKPNKYELPVHYEIKVTNHGESYLNGAYESFSFFREVLKDILNKNVRKIRFYVFMELTNNTRFGEVNYSFRYYVHY